MPDIVNWTEKRPGDSHSAEVIFHDIVIEQGRRTLRTWHSRGGYKLEICNYEPSRHAVDIGSLVQGTSLYIIDAVITDVM